MNHFFCIFSFLRHKLLFFIIVTFCLFWVYTPYVYSSATILFNTITVYLGWDPLPDPTVAGYYIYYKNRVTADYKNRLIVGNSTVCKLVLPSTYKSIYYFTVTAYDIYGNECNSSNQVTFIFDNTIESCCEAYGLAQVENEDALTPEDKMNLGLVGVYDFNYGRFKVVKIRKSQDTIGQDVYYAYCASNKYIMILRIEPGINNKDKRVIVKAIIPLEVKDIAIQEKDENIYGYFAGGGRGLFIFNLNDPNSPEHIAICDTPGNAINIVIDCDYAYIIDEQYGFQIINIENRKCPRKMGSYNASTKALAIKNNYAYVVDSSGNLNVVNITDKQHPENVYRPPITFQDKKVTGLYIITDSFSYSEPSPSDNQDIVIADCYAYIVNRDSGLDIINIEDGNSPFLLKNFEISGGAYAIDIDENYACLGNKNNGNLDISIIDIEDRTQPKIIENFHTPGDVYSVDIYDKLAYVADGEAGLQIIDLEALKSVGSFSAWGEAYDIALQDQFAYITYKSDNNQNRFLIMNVANKEDLKIVGSCDIPNECKGLVLKDDCAYLLSRDANIHIIRIQDENSPRLEKTFTIQGVDAIDIDGEYAYLLCGSTSSSNANLKMINLNNNLENINETEAVLEIVSQDNSFIRQYNDLAIKDGIAYLADSKSGLHIININDNNTHTLFNKCGLEEGALGIDIEGDYAYVISGDAKLIILYIKNKEEFPKCLNQFDIPRNARSINVQGDYAYVIDDYQGLQIFEITIGPQQNGNLILAACGNIDYSDPYFLATQDIANHVYNTFRKKDYGVYDIYYLNPLPLQDTDGDGKSNKLAVQHVSPTKNNLMESISLWAVDQSSNIGPLYIYLIGHGSEDHFQIMPGEVIKAQELKESIEKFQRWTNYTRQVVVVIEAAASGTFIDELIKAGVIVITSTNTGPSYIKPIFSDSTLSFDDPSSSDLKPSDYQSFTSTFINALGNLDSQIFLDNNPTTIRNNLKDAFLTYRQSLMEGDLPIYPFDDQVPQMVLPENDIVSLSFSVDGTLPVDNLTIDDQQEVPYYLTIIKQDPNGRYHSYSSDDLLVFSSDPGILNPDDPQDMEMEIDPNGILRCQIRPTRNGIVTLIAYADEAVNPDCLVSAKVTLEVSRDDLEYTIEKMAIIVAGYKGSGDYLWESTNTIGNHAYQTLRAMGYTDGEIYYYNPYLLQNLDKNGENYEIRGYPHLADIFDLSMNDSPFTLFKQSEATQLLLFFVDHGGQYEFYLNPKEILEADYLLERINEMIDPEKDERIVLLSDTCYSGSFVNTITDAITNDRYPHITADKFVAIASTKQDQKAYYINKGIVSFSYPFFDEWFLTHSLMEAYEYAKYSIPFDDQDACLSDPNRIKVWDRDDVYYIDDSRPVIDDVEYSRADGKVTITANINSLSGINRVWAIVDKTYNAPINTFGDAVTDASEFSFQFVEDSDNYTQDPNKTGDTYTLDILFENVVPSAVGLFNPQDNYAQDPNKYCGTYTLAIPDPCPHEANYTLFIYAMDKSSREKTSHYKVCIGSEAENNTIAFIIESGSTPLAGETLDIYEKRCSQVDRAVNILKSKGLSIDDKNIINDRNGLSNIFLEEEDKTLFIYLIGRVRIEDEVPYFYLTDGKLSNDEFFAYIPDDLDRRILFLVDTPYAREFLDTNASYWHENRIGIASTDQSKLFFHPTGSATKIYPCFSSFFFSSLLSGATVAQAYRVAKNAVSLTRQRPSLLPECTDYRTVDRRLGYYLGVSGIAGEEYSLFIDCNVTVETAPTGQRHYKLSLTPQQDANIYETWVVLTSSPSAMDHHSMIVDLEKDNDSDLTYYGDVHCDILYYNASFIIEGRTYGESDVNKKWYQYQEVSIAHESGDITDDRLEPDDDSVTILSNNNYKIDENGIPIRRTFYCANPHEFNDVDWVYFEAEHNTVYEIYAQDLSEYGYFVKLSLYDSTFNPLYDLPDSDQHITANNYLTFRCQESGLYLLEARLASSYPPCGVEYIVSVCNPQAGDITSVQGQVVNTQGEGINGLTIWIQDGGEFRKTSSINILGSSDGGYFYKSGMNVDSDKFYIKIGDPQSTDAYTNILKEFNYDALEPYSQLNEKKLILEDDIEIDYESENIMICKLPLSKGMNIFYFPSIMEVTKIGDIAPKCTIYYYDNALSSWEAGRSRIKANHFNAIYTPKAEYISLYRKSDSQQIDSSKPILWLKGFIDSSCEDPEKSNHIACLPDNLFDPDDFKLDEPNAAQRILDNQQIQMVIDRDTQDYAWKSYYHLFERSVGKDIIFKSYDVYIINKNKVETP